MAAINQNLGGWDPNFGPFGGYPPGTPQGGPDPNAPGYMGGRDAIVQAILAQQGFADPGLAGGQQRGDANSVDIGALFGGSTPSYDAGAPGAGAGIGRGAGTAPGGMVTADAAMAGSGQWGEGNVNAPVGGTNPFEAGASTGRGGFVDTSFSAFGGRGGAGREGFGTAITMGGTTPAAPAAPAVAPDPFGSSTTNPPGATPVTTTSFTAPTTAGFPTYGPFDPFSPTYAGRPSGNVLPDWSDPFSPAPAGWGRAPTPASNLPEIVVTAPRDQPPDTPPDPNDTTDQNDPGDNSGQGWGGGGGPTGGSGFGGFGAFGGGAATGGFSGSASMGNTTGAEGFNAGGGGRGDFGAASPGTGGFTAGGGFGGFGTTGGFEGGAPSGPDPGNDGTGDSGDTSW